MPASPRSHRHTGHTGHTGHAAPAAAQSARKSAAQQRRDQRSGAPTTDDAVHRRRSQLQALITERSDAISIAASHRLSRDIRRADSQQDCDAIAAKLEAETEKIARRKATLPTPDFPESLPVTAKRAAIAEAIADHQVVVIAGETGSGKTTQIPKICLALGRGVRGAIGHTQPRRLAARSVAARIAEELNVPLGKEVGYEVRFDDKSGPDTAIKLMTDGILLNEIRRDRFLRAYDTIIIDEAHERSLNIDFLLGYLAEILPRRPDLKVVITSATIDPARFARHFSERLDASVPVIEVSGRTYPVDIRYRPLEVDVDGRTELRDELDALCDAVAELLREGDGDILVFLSGEREIRDAEEALRGRKFPGLEIFPLFSRLSVADQQKAFRQHSQRRVVLATNIAETSVTVPGIHYVIDTGLARISRYSTRTKVQRLPIEPVSQASANQRAGRSGRVTEGVCIRLYSREDYEQRPEFTDPEIQRTNLASVILQMADLGLGDIASFPFIDPPDSRAVRDGIQVLTELGALRSHDRHGLTLTRRGRDIAALPLDPRLARMIIAGQESGSLAEVIVIVAALTIGDVRERPAEQRDKAASLHLRFTDRTSDFLGYLNVWRYLTEQRSELSGSAFRRMCRDEFLHWLRIREWQDLVSQLDMTCREQGWHPGSLNASDDDIHRALLAGLLSSIGTRKDESREYHGARGISFVLHPSSAVTKKPPQWVMASELVETSRLFARDVARIDPAWVEPLAKHLLKRQYLEPHWSAKQGAALAYERVTLFGLPIIERRRIQLSRVDPALARELFVRHGVIEEQWHTRAPEFLANQQALAAARDVESRARRTDTVIDDEALLAWYLERIPTSVVSGRHCESWLRKASAAERKRLRLTDTDIYIGSERVSAADFPPKWRQGDMTFDLEYTHETGAENDGVSVLIPVARLPQVRAAGFEWLVPGMRAELYTALLRTLPKMYRRLATPAASFADLLAADLTPRSAPLVPAVAAALSARIGTTVPPSEFSMESLAPHLRMNFVLVDESDKKLDSDYSLSQLQQRWAERARAELTASLVDDAAAFREWTAQTIGDLADEVHSTAGGVEVRAYPALEVRDDGIHRIVCATRTERDTAMRRALVELLRPGLVSSSQLLKGRSPIQRLALTQYPFGGFDALLSDTTSTAIGRVMALNKTVPLRYSDFCLLRDQIRETVPSEVAKTITAVLPALVGLAKLDGEIDAIRDREIADALRAEREFLLGRGFTARHSGARLHHLPRHVESLTLRAVMAREHPGRYAELLQRVAPSEALIDDALQQLSGRPGATRSARELRWLLAELRVSVFTQRLGTSSSVSPQRIAQAAAAACRGER